MDSMLMIIAALYTLALMAPLVLRRRIALHQAQWTPLQHKQYRLTRWIPLSMLLNAVALVLRQSWPAMPDWLNGVLVGGSLGVALLILIQLLRLKKQAV